MWRLQEGKHICGITGDGVIDALSLTQADIGIALVNATDATRNASDIVLTEPGLNVIINAVMTSRAIFQGMRNYIVSSRLYPRHFSLEHTKLFFLLNIGDVSHFGSPNLQIFAVSIAFLNVVSIDEVSSFV